MALPDLRHGLLLAAAAAVAACSASTSPSGPRKSVTAIVTPQDAQTYPRGNVQYYAEVAATSDQRVDWAVVDGAGAGTIDSSGLYTAPASAGTYRVRAESRAVPGTFGYATVVVTAAPAITVTIAKRDLTLPIGGTFTFEASVAGTTNRAVSWSIQEGSPQGGQITSAGVYTAPSTAGTYHVKATSQADTARSDTVPVVVTPTVATSTMTVSGNQILDSCGNPVRLVGADQTFGYGFETPTYDASVNPQGGSLENLVDIMAQSGANFIRLAMDFASGQPSLTRYEQLIQRANAAGMVVSIAYYNSSLGPNQYDSPEMLAWWAAASTQAFVQRNSRWLLLEAFQETNWPTREGWRDAVIQRIGYIRGLGYTQPIIALAPFAGRDLIAILQYGAAIQAADPLHRVILDWEAYWGSSSAGTPSYYEGIYNDYWTNGGKMGLSFPTTIPEAIARAAQEQFPILLDFDYATDAGQSCWEYSDAITAAHTSNMSWAWWFFYHPWDPGNSLLRKDASGSTPGGTLTNLTSPFGNVVLNTNLYGLHSGQKVTCR